LTWPGSNNDSQVDKTEKNADIGDITTPELIDAGGNKIFDYIRV